MTERRYLYTLEEIKARLQGRALELARVLAPGGHVAGAEYVTRNPSRMDRKAGSFSVNYRKGVWKDFATEQGGDMLAFVAEFATAGDYKRAVKWAKDFLGLSGYEPNAAESTRIEAQAKKVEQDEIRKAEGRRRTAFRLLCDASPLDGCDPASLYLKARGIDVTKLAGGIPRALRFHPRVRAFPEGTEHPAMLAFMSLEGLKNGFAACHRTYLESYGGVWKKAERVTADGEVLSAKSILGSFRGASVRLCAGASGKKLGGAPADEWIIFGEGIENVLTCALARPSLRAIAGGAGGNLSNVRFPDQIGGLFLVKDNDSDPKAIERFANQCALLNERHAIAVVEFDAAFKDANDVLMGKRRA